MTNYTILLYHGVYNDDLDSGPRNSSGKHIPRCQFDEEMRWLSKNKPLTTMRQIARAHAGKATLPDKAVAVTFDDGFLNNYTEAWPVLEKYNIPSTIYLATGFIGTGRIGWGDRIEDAIMGSANTELTLFIDGHPRSWLLKGSEKKISAFTEVKAICKKLQDADKNAIIGTIDRTLSYKSQTDHPLYNFMDWNQVREMNKSQLIDFGAHTIDHVSLSRVPEEEMHRQIDGSVSTLIQELGKPCELFSYPEGQSDDFNDTVIRHLQHHGFDHCPTAIDGDNTLETTDPFHIRRIMVGFEGRAFPFY